MDGAERVLVPGDREGGRARATARPTGCPVPDVVLAELDELARPSSGSRRSR